MTMEQLHKRFAKENSRDRGRKIRQATDILYLLQTRRGITTKDVAAELGIGIKSARRYLNGVLDSKYPIIVEEWPSSYGGNIYSLPDEFKVGRGRQNGSRDGNRR